MHERADIGRPAFCLVIDEEPEVGRFIERVGHDLGIDVRFGVDLDALTVALRLLPPRAILLDVPLGAADAIEAIRMLEARHYDGAICLMGGRDRMLLDYVQMIAERHNLRVKPPLVKPLDAAAVSRALRGDGWPVAYGKESRDAVEIAP